MIRFQSNPGKDKNYYLHFLISDADCLVQGLHVDVPGKQARGIPGGRLRRDGESGSEMTDCQSENSEKHRPRRGIFKAKSK